MAKGGQITMKLQRIRVKVEALEEPQKNIIQCTKFTQLTGQQQNEIRRMTTTNSTQVSIITQDPSPLGKDFFSLTRHPIST